MRDSSFIQSRDRFVDFLNRKQETFEIFTLKESSLFEQVETKIEVEKITMKISNEMNEIASTSKTRREQNREQDREREQNERQNKR